VYEDSFFPTFLPTFVGGGVFGGSYPNRGEVDLNAVLICISFMARDGEHFFHVFFFFAGRGGQSVQGLCWFIPGWVWEYHMLLICPPVGLLDVSQAGSEPAVQEPSCFLSVTWHGEALYRLGVQGVKVLILLDFFFSAKCASILSAKFLICGAHAVFSCTLVTILDQLFEIFVYLKPGNIYICSKSSVGVLDN
jgi:hypothetical protein